MLFRLNDAHKHIRNASNVMEKWNWSLFVNISYRNWRSIWNIIPTLGVFSSLQKFFRNCRNRMECQKHQNANLQLVHGNGSLKGIPWDETARLKSFSCPVVSSFTSFNEDFPKFITNVVCTSNTGRPLCHGVVTIDTRKSSCWDPYYVIIKKFTQFSLALYLEVSWCRTKSQQVLHIIPVHCPWCKLLRNNSFSRIQLGGIFTSCCGIGQKKCSMDNPGQYIRVPTNQQIYGLQ